MGMFSCQKSSNLKWIDRGSVRSAAPHARAPARPAPGGALRSHCVEAGRPPRSPLPPREAECASGAWPRPRPPSPAQMPA